MKWDCLLCDQPGTLPIFEVWCAKCGSFIRAHHGCSPGLDHELVEKMRSAHAFSHPHHGSDCEWARDRTRYVAPWDRPLDRPDYLKGPSTHEPATMQGRRGLKVKP